MCIRDRTLTELTVDEILHKYRSADDKFLVESFGTIAAYGGNACLLYTSDVLHGCHKMSSRYIQHERKKAGIFGQPSLRYGRDTGKDGICQTSMTKAQPAF